MKINWTNDPFMESVLAGFGISWRIEDVNLDDIDWTDSRTNSARLADPVKEETVDEYAVAMEAGDTFPMMVVQKRRGKKYLVWGGNHRGPAARKTGVASAKMYVVDTDDLAAADLVPRILNRGHGMRQTRDEAIEHAIYAVNQHGYEPRQAAKIFGLRRDAVSQEIRIRELRTELDQQGIEARTLSKGALRQLSTISANTNVLLAAAATVASSKLPESSVKELVADVKKNRTELTQMRAIADHKEKIGAATRQTKVPKSTRTKFLQCLTTMEGYVDGRTSLTQLQITDGREKDAVGKRLRDLAAKLKTLQSEGRKEGDNKYYRRRAS